MNAQIKRYGFASRLIAKGEPTVETYQGDIVINLPDGKTALRLTPEAAEELASAIVDANFNLSFPGK
jgi:hypothetical protein